MMQMLLLLAAAKGSLAGIGFCILDTRQQPEALQGTGYAASNALTEGECGAAGEDWCPLDDAVRTFAAVNASVEYYWWSACCTGMQVRTAPSSHSSQRSVPSAVDFTLRCQRARMMRAEP